MTLVFNTAAVDPANALVRSVTQTQPAVKPVFVLGDKKTVYLYLSDGAGGYDSRSGTTGYTPWLGIGTPGESASSGTFALAVSSATSGSLTNGKRYLIQTFETGDNFSNVGAAANETGEIFTASGTTPTTWSNGSTLYEITTDLAYNATAAAVEAALEATQAVTGVTVTKPGAAANYVVEWDDVGAKAALVGVAGSLVPNCAVVISELQSGSATVREKQSVRITRQPAALQTTWTQITNGWSARLDCATNGMLQLLDGAASVSSTLELQIQDVDGNIDTVGQVDCLVRNETIDEASLSPDAFVALLSAAASNLAFVQNRSGITGLTGGAATDLDGISTYAAGAAVVATGTMVALDISGEISHYELVTGTDSESSPSVIRPDDYASTTNERVWKLRKSIGVLATSYEAVSFSAAGNTDITPSTNSESHAAVATVSAGAGFYTRTVSLLTAGRSAGNLCSIRFAMPASTNPTVQVRDATSGGTLLTTIAGEAGGVPVMASYIFTGSAWVELSAAHIE